MCAPSTRPTLRGERMSTIDTAKLAPVFGATDLRVYYFDDIAAGEKTLVWLCLGGPGVSIRCSISAEQARLIAAGLVQAASAIEALSTMREH